MMKRSTSCRKGLEEIAEKQNKAQGKETKIKADAVSSSSQTGKSDLVNRTIQFLQDQCRRGASKTIVPRTVPTTRWCPLGLTPSQRKRNQWVRAQKLREEAAKKERDGHFNAIRSVIPMK
jgi:hypothetical protein